MVSLTVSLAMVGGSVFLSNGGYGAPSSASPSLFIRCEEDTGGTCDSQCEDAPSEICGSTICCARQYYENGECEDEHEDEFICYGYPKDTVH